MSSQIGIGIVPSTQRFYQENAKPQAEIGRKIALLDGREFVYCLNGNAPLSAGHLVKTTDIVAGHQKLAISRVHLRGDETVSITLGATAGVTVNQYADGYIFLSNGYTLRIKRHPKAEAKATLKVTLEEELPLQLDTTMTATLVASPFKNVVLSTKPADFVLGFVPIDVKANNYFWVQTKGIATALADDTAGGIVLGAYVMTSNKIAGAVCLATAGNRIIGQTLDKLDVNKRGAIQIL